MRIIGQKHIAVEFESLLPFLFTNRNVGINILLRGPSGYGKTHLALEICNYLAGSSFQIFTARFNLEEFKKRVIFIDEVHKIPNLELLYPMMDINIKQRSDRTTILIFATNADSILLEAFENRCKTYIFSEYTDDELLYIAKENMDFYANDFSILQIIEASQRNPRILIKNLRKFSVYFQMHTEIDSRKSDFKVLLEKVFSIKDGLDVLSREYIKILRDVGGIASLSLLSNILHVDADTLKNKIEPILCKRKIIKITSKGRSLA